MTRFTKVSTVLALALVATAGTAKAQNFADINITANVYATLLVSGDNPLAFGNVFPGLALPTAVAVVDAGAGKWSVTGEAGANVSLTFALDAVLAGPGADIPILSWTAHRAVTDVRTGGTTFNPAAGVENAVLGGAGTLFVYIGASIQPPNGQVAGSYSGIATMTVDYF